MDHAGGRCSGVGAQARVRLWVSHREGLIPDRSGPRSGCQSRPGAASVCGCRGERDGRPPTPASWSPGRVTRSSGPGRVGGRAGSSFPRFFGEVSGPPDPRGQGAGEPGRRTAAGAWSPQGRWCRLAFDPPGKAAGPWVGLRSRAARMASTAPTAARAASRRVTAWIMVRLPRSRGACVTAPCVRTNESPAGARRRGGGRSGPGLRTSVRGAVPAGLSGRPSPPPPGADDRRWHGGAGATTRRPRRPWASPRPRRRPRPGRAARRATCRTRWRPAPS